MEESFAKAECLVPFNRKGVQQGFTRWNSTTDYREKPVFRFDGKFVCSVVRMSAGGHHTCLLFGITSTGISSKLQLASNVVNNCYSRALQHLSPCEVSLRLSSVLILPRKLTRGQAMKSAPTATRATWSALAGTTTTRVQCRNALTEENRRSSRCPVTLTCFCASTTGHHSSSKKFLQV